MDRATAMLQIHRENLLPRQYGVRSGLVVLIRESRISIVMKTNPYAIMLCEPQPAAAGAKSGMKTSTGTPEDSFSECMPSICDYDEEWMSFVERHSMESCWASKHRTEADLLPRVWNLPPF